MLLGGNLSNRIAALVTVLIKRIDGEKPFGDQRNNQKSDDQEDYPDDMFWHEYLFNVAAVTPRLDLIASHVNSARVT